MRDWDFFLVPYSVDSRGHRVSVHLERSGDDLHFRYKIEGRDVKHAPFTPDESSRRDELWKTTCFEFFLARPDGTAYFEINMATSGDWNAYAFDGYREGMRRAEGVKSSPIRSVCSSEDKIELEGRFVLSDFFGDFPLLGPVVLGATAVVEYRDGTKDYWALAHKGEKPDFHVRESFVANI